MSIAPESSRPVLDPATLRSSFGAFATGVTVVTVGGSPPHGMTANSFTSVSLEPPLILVCVQRDALMHRRLLARRRFGVSVLAADQEKVARHFADRNRALGDEQFDPIDWTPGRLTRAPLIEGALAHFEGQIRDLHPAGDHTLFVGELLSCERQDSDEALLFFQGRFDRVGCDGVAP
jgi:flavin reductase (DIM6/NTAB) family NADH-FMN oxidoreductase RutF